MKTLEYCTLTELVKQVKSDTQWTCKQVKLDTTCLVLFADGINKEVTSDIVHIRYKDRCIDRHRITRVDVLLNPDGPMLPLSCNINKSHKVQDIQLSNNILISLSLSLLQTSPLNELDIPNLSEKT